MAVSSVFARVAGGGFEIDTKRSAGRPVGRADDGVVWGYATVLVSKT